VKAQSRLLNTALWIGVTVVVFHLLYLGQRLLIPLIVAVLLVFLIHTLANAIQRIPRIGRFLPRMLCFAAAIVIILATSGFVGAMIIDNVTDAVVRAPGYQARIDSVIADVAARFDVEDTPTLSELLGGMNFSSMLRSFATAVTALVSSAGIIIVYVLFLLFEVRVFMRKLDRIFTEREQRAAVEGILENCGRDIRTYIGIKSLVSLITGLLSYLVLIGAGVDLAEFWAILIFLLNFIPTIGSIIGVIFPSLLTLVQFDSMRPFVVVTSLLIAIQFTIGNVIEPRITGRSLNLSPIVILLSLGLWGSVWGIPGMFMAVPITVIIMIFLKYFPNTRWIAVLLSSDGDIGPARIPGNHDAIGERA